MALGLGPRTSPVPFAVLLCFLQLCDLAPSGELADVTYHRGTPQPLTKQKTVDCYGENVKKNDGRNFEIEKIRKKEDVIETLNSRSSRNTKCVVVTSVSDDDSAADIALKEYSPGGGIGGSDDSLGHNVRFDGPSRVDISSGPDFDVPSLNSDFGNLHESPGLDDARNSPGLDIPPIPSVPSVGSDFRDLPKLDVLKPPYSGGGQADFDSGFGNLKDINKFRSGGGGAPDAGHAQEENVKTYGFATNIHRQETYDHRGYHQERSRVAAPGGGWRTTYSFEGPHGGGLYETSANDIDQKIRAAGGGGRALLAPGPVALALLALAVAAALL